MDSFITTFHIDWKILIAQGINFAIVLLLLYFFALKPLKKVMSERTTVIEKGIADAKHNAELVTKAEMMASAQAEVESMIATGKKNLEAEKNKMVEEAKVEIVSLVVAATEKILKDQGDKSVTEKAIKNINHI